MSLRPTKAVFLDRDGVVIRSIVRDGKPFPAQTLDEVELEPDAEAALAMLHGAGYLLILISNQPDVARGTQDRAVVEAINTDLSSRLPLDDCFVCYHDDRDLCGCRKPLPGLILRATERHHVDLATSFMVGDRWRDIEAGQAAGCRTIWIDRGYAERSSTRPADTCVANLKEAAEWILTSIKV